MLNQIELTLIICSVNYFSKFLINLNRNIVQIITTFIFYHFIKFYIVFTANFLILVSSSSEILKPKKTDIGFGNLIKHIPLRF